jgi:hypothetical protein
VKLGYCGYTKAEKRIIVNTIKERECLQSCANESDALKVPNKNRPKMKNQKY